MSPIYTVSVYREYDDVEWSSPIGYVTSLANAFLWAKSQIDMELTRMNVVGKEVGYTHQLIETQEQFKYFEQFSSAYRVYLGRDKVKFPVILPSDVTEDSYEFEIIYYIGVETRLNQSYVEVRHWKFTLVGALEPIVVQQ